MFSFSLCLFIQRETPSFRSVPGLPWAPCSVSIPFSLFSTQEGERTALLILKMEKLSLAEIKMNNHTTNERQIDDENPGKFSSPNPVGCMEMGFPMVLHPILSKRLLERCDECKSVFSPAEGETTKSPGLWLLSPSLLSFGDPQGGLSDSPCSPLRPDVPSRDFDFGSDFRQLWASSPSVAMAGMFVPLPKGYQFLELRCLWLQKALKE